MASATACNKSNKQRAVGPLTTLEEPINHEATGVHFHLPVMSQLFKKTIYISASRNKKEMGNRNQYSQQAWFYLYHPLVSSSYTYSKLLPENFSLSRNLWLHDQCSVLENLPLI
ncbi:unnamed protein product, partial [Musa acuminata subsp. burmannicoides]